MDKKWDELAYELTTDAGKRSLMITPHFQQTSTGWFDTGKYTIAEGGRLLGNIYVDLYTGRPPRWDGKKDEFTSKQIYDIVNHIVFKDVAGLPNVF